MVLHVLLKTNKKKASLDEVDHPNKTTLLKEIITLGRIRGNQPGNFQIIVKYMLIL
jgi:hypothetical protein